MHSSVIYFKNHNNIKKWMENLECNIEQFSIVNEYIYDLFNLFFAALKSVVLCKF